MQEIISRFLQSSHIDPVYFVTGIADIVALFLWGKLKKGLSNTQRALYKAIILVAIILTAAVLCKVFGVINDWKELKSIWKP
jgi:predicted MFS family arabinose efflux permease